MAKADVLCAVQASAWHGGDGKLQSVDYWCQDSSVRLHALPEGNVVSVRTSSLDTIPGGRGRAYVLYTGTSGADRSGLDSSAREGAPGLDTAAIAAAHRRRRLSAHATPCAAHWAHIVVSQSSGNTASGGVR